MRNKLLIVLGILAVIGGLTLGAIVGVIFVGLAIGVVGAAVVGLIGWGAGKAAQHKLDGPDERERITDHS